MGFQLLMYGLPEPLLIEEMTLTLTSCSGQDPKDFQDPSLSLIMHV